ncbi:hypothetical protein VQ056_02755 [Paenibacillus sp. JTLBN-2024]
MYKKKTRNSEYPAWFRKSTFSPAKRTNSLLIQPNFIADLSGLDRKNPRSPKKEDRAYAAPARCQPGGRAHQPPAGALQQRNVSIGNV